MVAANSDSSKLELSQPLSGQRDRAETDCFRQFAPADLVALDRFCEFVPSLQPG
jgi:hypothetical protein